MPGRGRNAPSARRPKSRFEMLDDLNRRFAVWRREGIPPAWFGWALWIAFLVAASWRVIHPGPVARSRPGLFDRSEHGPHERCELGPRHRPHLRTARIPVSPESLFRRDRRSLVRLPRPRLRLVPRRGDLAATPPLRRLRRRRRIVRSVLPAPTRRARGDDNDGCLGRCILPGGRVLAADRALDSFVVRRGGGDPVAGEIEYGPSHRGHGALDLAGQARALASDVRTGKATGPRPDHESPIRRLLLQQCASRARERPRAWSRCAG